MFKNDIFPCGKTQLNGAQNIYPKMVQFFQN